MPAAPRPTPPATCPAPPTSTGPRSPASTRTSSGALWPQPRVLRSSGRGGFVPTPRWSSTADGPAGWRPGTIPRRPRTAPLPPASSTAKTLDVLATTEVVEAWEGTLLDAAASSGDEPVITYCQGGLVVVPQAGARSTHSLRGPLTPPRRTRRSRPEARSRTRHRRGSEGPRGRPARSRRRPPRAWCAGGSASSRSARRHPRGSPP